MSIQIPLFLIPLIVGIFNQIVKIGLDFLKTKTITIGSLRSAGGFPSVHSGISSSITTLVFLHEGPNSMIFAVAFAFSFLFRYDAMNIRYEAGKHANYINTIRTELQSVLAFDQHFHYLKERLGHTPTEVIAGIISGILTTTLLYRIFYGGSLGAF